MKTKRVLIGISIAAVISAVILISLKAYYVLVAIVIGGLLIGHRELWSLLTTKKLPPFDERVKENTSKAIRNGFVFFALASVVLMLIFSVNREWKPELLHVMGGLFITAGTVYLLSYLFFDRAQPNLSARRLRMLKKFLILAGSSVAVFILGAFLHNIVSLFGIEEAVFFTIATIIAPLGLVVGLIASLVIFIMGLIAQKR
jgi:hypothetical protein